MNSWADIVRQVEARAEGRCEYCRMHQSLQGATFHVEHVVPRSQGGAPKLENLAWACPGCNLRKSDRTQAIDPDSGEIVSLFNPRLSQWSDHFCWEGFRVRGETPEGRATISALEMNHRRRLLIREAEKLFALFSP